MRRRRARALAFGLGLALLLALLPDAVGWALWGPPPSADMVFASPSRFVVERRGDHARVRGGGGLVELEIPVVRQPGRARVLVFGESSVRRGPAGAPSDFPTALAALLPGVEVLNLGAPGVKMADIADLVEQLDVERDLLLLYSGHNEYADVFFNGAVAAWPRWRVRAVAWARQSWLHGLLRPPRPRPDRAMGLPATGDRLVPVSAPFPTALGAGIEANFRSALQRFAAAAEAPVLVVTLLRNPGRPPVGLVVDEAHPDCRAVAAAAVAAPGASLLSGLRQACGEAPALEAWLRMRAALSVDAALAAAEFRTVLETDPIPLRAPPAIDRILGEVAAAEDLVLYDLAAALGPLPSDRLFDDVVHPNEAGAALIARQLAPQVEARLAGVGRLR